MSLDDWKTAPGAHDDNCPCPACDEAREFIESVTYDDDHDRWCDTCQNLGEIDCECGGDLCICLNYGSMPCPDCHG